MSSNGLLLYQVSWYGADANGKPWPKTWNTVEDCCAQSNWDALRTDYVLFRSGNPTKEVVSDSESEESGSSSESSYDPDESESESSSSSEEEVEAPKPSSRKRGMESLMLPPGKRLKMTTLVSLESDSNESETD